MAVVPTGSAPAVFDLKNTSLPLVAVVLRSADPRALAQALDERLRDTPHFFNHDPVVLDVSALRQAVVDFAALLPLLRRYRMQPVAVSGASPEQMVAAVAAGLSEAPPPSPPAAPRVEVREVVKEVVKEVVREVPTAVPTMVVDRPLRSGQQIYARGGDLIVLAPVNIGAEVIADGHVHVYAPLRGKAIAGARGNTDARIFTTCLEPELIAVAGVYRTTENPIPAELQGKPAQVRLVGDKLVMEALKN